MVETMHAAPGIGLAAPQVGIDLRLAVVDLSVGESPEALLVLINPRIVDQEGAERSTSKGAFRSPASPKRSSGRPASWSRQSHKTGEPFSIEAEDWMARAICHELDHLDGVLFTDRLSGLKKDKAKRALRRLVEEQQGVLV